MGSDSILRQLVSLAREVLETPVNEPAFLAQLERYAAAFENWQQSLKDPAQEDLARALTTAEGQELLKAHAEIVQRAESSRGAVSDELKALKKRGKGILAYTDLLPKRIPTMKTRKG